MSGFGIFTWETNGGRQYVGQWKNGRRHGYGFIRRFSMSMQGNQKIASKDPRKYSNGKKVVWEIATQEMLN